MNFRTATETESPEQLFVRGLNISSKAIQDELARHDDVMRRNLGWFEQWWEIEYEGGADIISKYESTETLSLKERIVWAPFLRERGAI